MKFLKLLDVRARFWNDPRGRISLPFLTSSVIWRLVKLLCRWVSNPRLGNKPTSLAASLSVPGRFPIPVRDSNVLLLKISATPRRGWDILYRMSSGSFGKPGLYLYGIIFRVGYSWSILTTNELTRGNWLYHNYAIHIYIYSAVFDHQNTVIVGWNTCYWF